MFDVQWVDVCVIDTLIDTLSAHEHSTYIRELT